MSYSSDYSDSDSESEEQQILGRSSYGDVKAGSVNGRLMAIKYFSEFPSWSEIDVMTNYQHENVMKATMLEEVDVQNRGAYAMEIGSKIAILNLDEFLDFLKQSITGLHFLHSHNVLHLDIKPDNFVRVDDKVKYIDFGVSMIVTEKDMKGFQTNDVRGTFPYIAPESNKTLFASYGMDVFALGLTFLGLFVNFEKVFKEERKELYQYYVLEGGTENSWELENDVLWYYFQKKRLFEVDNRREFVSGTLAHLNPPKHILDLITSMLSWNKEDRPTAEQLPKKLKIKPVPGSFSMYVPDQLRNFDIKDLVENESGGYGFPVDLDVIDLFRCLDLYMRLKDTHFNKCVSLGLMYSKYYRNDGIINIPDIAIRKIDRDYPSSDRYRHYPIAKELKSSLGSCNVLYRLANSVEALVYLTTIDVTKVDFKVLKEVIDANFTPGSKEITIKAFLKLL